MSRLFSLVCVGLLVALVMAVLLVDAEEVREKRAPILGLLLAKKLLFGHHHHHHHGYGHHGYGHGHGGYGGYGGYGRYGHHYG